ncbi:hypothetical protein [Mesorhizobium sp. B2-4-17]|uniref:hypothetical protein n=1 Tax=Mesorhizobium sp. B2-4-17 TaxID=2589932 RepID=UPI00112C01B6|nr:hypothetical protein [Mesorhizobium sp. B2-4-17]TPK78112.1 hypothetical protein FJ548_25250 [Mesorhizobium sp. B2-4-17]
MGRGRIERSLTTMDADEQRQFVEDVADTFVALQAKEVKPLTDRLWALRTTRSCDAYLSARPSAC